MDVNSPRVPYDVVVIGGGVVGCAVTRRLTVDGARTALIEKSSDILQGASKANSAILHTGFDAPSASVELNCMKDGYEEYLSIHQSLGLPLLKTSAIVTAWTDDEEQKLESIFAKALANGVTDIEVLSKPNILSREPNISHKVKAGILVKGEHVIDPWSAPYAYLKQAVDNGADAFFSAEVYAGHFDGELWHLETPRGVFQTRNVINCAGLYGDVLDERVLGDASFQIKPRKGQFVVFDKSASKIVSSIILPVPSARTKGIVVCRTIFGNVLVGPTAEEQESREDASVDRDTLKALITKAVDIFPVLKDVPVTATYAGLRPASEQKEYRILDHPSKHWVSVGGIRSTGLTASLGIAKLVSSLLTNSSRVTKTELTSPIINKVPNLSEYAERDWAKPDHGEIVCHCELVTKREIEGAMELPLPARSLGALKRRTRATLGRCQGFYCSARLSELCDNKLTTPLSVETKNV